MKILGVDPGLRTSGYAVIADQGPDPAVIDAGVFRADPDLPLAQRLQQLHHDITELLQEHRPDQMAVEELYAHYRHPRTAILMGHARGVFLLAAAQQTVPVLDFSATRVKKSLTGTGRASKQQIQRAVTLRLNLPCIPEPPDVADALAIAMCCLNQHQHVSIP